MDRNGLGFVGGLAANRPLLAVLLLAFGLTALSAFGVLDPAPRADAAEMIASMMVAGIAIVVAPLLVFNILPRSLPVRAFAAGALLILALVAFMAGLIPRIGGVSLQASELAAMAILAAFLLVVGRAFGSLLRFAFIAVVASLLGTAAAMGIIAHEGVLIAQGLGPLAGLALAMGSLAGLGTISDFTILFARGAENRRAAAVSAQYSAAWLVYAALASAAAVVLGNGSGGAFKWAWLTGVSVALPAAAALFVCVGALAVRRSNEALAVDENHRRQSFRKAWRPLRRVFPPSTSLAIIGVSSIATVAAAFNLQELFPLWKLLFIGVAAILAGLIFFSLRTGLFVFLELIICSVITAWICEVAAAPRLAPADEAAVLAVAASLMGHLALAWRDSRSPRLNARETAEAAMMDAVRLYSLGAIIAAAAFFATFKAGIWDAGAIAGAYVGVFAIMGMALAPAFMTALSHTVRRDFA